MKRIITFLLLVLLSGTLLAQRTKHVIIVVLDGARYSETFGDPIHQYVPKIWTNLRPQGVIYTSYYNDGLTETNPGHSSIVTGTWQYITNSGSERPHAPTVFEYYRKARGTTADENYVLLGKTKLDILAYSDNSDYGSTYKASVLYSNSQYSDFLAWDNLKSAIASNHPRLMVLNLPATDNGGHSGSWTSYVSALRNADSLINEIWNLVQTDSVLTGKTTMFVTNDHGRHLDNAGGFREHGDGCEGCRHLILMAIGPDTPAGVVDSSLRKQIDVAPTVGALLGFQTPYSTGKVISSAIVTHAGDLALSVPQESSLFQNYPNPFNPATNIKFQVPSTSQVTLKVFDVLGREVALLITGQKDAGAHQVLFDGRNLSSGMYLYRLEVMPGGKRQAFTETRKMSLAK